MIPEIGLFSLILALLAALAQGILPLVGAATGWQAGLRVARPAAIGQFGLTTVAFCCLAWAFVDNDFSVLYVAANSHADLPAEAVQRGRELGFTVVKTPVGHGVTWSAGVAARP